MIKILARSLVVDVVFESKQKKLDEELKLPLIVARAIQGRSPAIRLLAGCPPKTSGECVKAPTINVAAVHLCGPFEFRPIDSQLSSSSSSSASS